MLPNCCTFPIFMVADMLSTLCCFCSWAGRMSSLRAMVAQSSCFTASFALFWWLRSPASGRAAPPASAQLQKQIFFFLLFCFVLFLFSSKVFCFCHLVGACECALELFSNNIMPKNCSHYCWALLSWYGKKECAP